MNTECRPGMLMRQLALTRQAQIRERLANPEHLRQRLAETVAPGFAGERPQLDAEVDQMMAALGFGAPPGRLPAHF